MKRKQLIRLKKIAISFVVLSVFGVFAYVYFKTDVFTITTYAFSYSPAKSEHIQEMKLLSSMQDIEEKQLFYIFPANRIFSFHLQDIRSKIQELYPNVWHVDISPRGLHTLSIKLYLYTPLFKVENMQAITKDGIVYTEINPDLHIPTLYFGSTTPPTAKELETISKLITQVGDILFPIDTITIDEYRDIYLYDANKKHSLIVSSAGDIDTIWSTIISAIDTEPLKTKLNKNANSLEYIDARYNNKVFYKFTNASSTSIIQENNATTTISTTTAR